MLASCADLNLGFSAPPRLVTTVAHPSADSATVAPIMSALDVIPVEQMVQQSMRGKWKRTPKSGEAMKDVLATGRARAKLLSQLTQGISVSGPGLRFAGGGVIHNHRVCQHLVPLVYITDQTSLCCTMSPLIYINSVRYATNDGIFATMFIMVTSS